jgi:hypothetical protein
MKSTVAGLCLLFLCLPIGAQSKHKGKGQWALVMNHAAPIYKNSEGDALLGKLPKGMAVAGITTMARLVESYQFEDENNRVHVLGLNEKEGSAFQGWMNRSDLSPYYTYECGCGLKNAECSPHVLERLHYKWNICFEDAVQNKLAESEKAPDGAAPKSSESPEERLKSLKSLFDKGLITKEEYEQKRAEILKSM